MSLSKGSLTRMSRYWAKRDKTDIDTNVLYCDDCKGKLGILFVRVFDDKGDLTHRICKGCSGKRLQNELTLAGMEL